MASSFVDDLRGWRESATMSDDARRKVWMMHTAAARIEELEDALRLILPLAKGYAAAHRVGDNDGKVAQAERILTNPGDN